MRFVSFTRNGSNPSYGLLLPGEKVLDLPKAVARVGRVLPATLAGLIAEGADTLAGLGTLDTAQAEPLAAVRLTAPIPRPAKNVFCVGRNYVDHVNEGYRAAGVEAKLPQAPQFFTKPPTAVAGPDSPFPHDPSVTQRLDYEVELALIIGKPGRDIPRANALDHVFGITVLNDLTARDLQRRHDQWFKGKGLDNSCPMGPSVVTLDEVPDLAALELTSRVNGEERQRSRVSHMIFDIPEIIAQLSAGMTLEPGDIIATGTPSGVGYAMDPPRFLTAGDVVTCEIAGIGALSTPIVAAARKAAA